jgi:hypothetical protein
LLRFLGQQSIAVALSLKGVLQEYRFIALWSGRDHRDGLACNRFDSAQERLRF